MLSWTCWVCGETWDFTEVVNEVVDENGYILCPSCNCIDEGA